MPKVHFRILVIEDNILYNLAHIKCDVLNDHIIQQSPLSCHFTHISCGTRAGCDEVMPYLGDVGQMFGLEVHDMTVIVKLPLPLAFGKQSKDLKVVRVFL